LKKEDEGLEKEVEKEVERILEEFNKCKRNGVEWDGDRITELSPLEADLEIPKSSLPSEFLKHLNSTSSTFKLSSLPPSLLKSLHASGILSSLRSSHNLLSLSSLLASHRFPSIAHLKSYFKKPLSSLPQLYQDPKIPSLTQNKTISDKKQKNNNFELKEI
jgi:hypothetical protein